MFFISYTAYINKNSLSLAGFERLNASLGGHAEFQFYIRTILCTPSIPVDSTAYRVERWSRNPKVRGHAIPLVVCSIRNRKK